HRVITMKSWKLIFKYIIPLILIVAPYFQSKFAHSTVAMPGLSVIKESEDRQNLVKEYLSLLNESNDTSVKHVTYLKDKAGTTEIQAENATLLAKTKEKQLDEMRRRVGVQKEDIKEAKVEAKVTLKEVEREKAAAAEREELAKQKHILAETELLFSKEKEKLLNEKDSLIALKGEFAQIRLDVTTDLASLTLELIRNPERTRPLEGKYETLDTANSETLTSIDTLKKDLTPIENELKTTEQMIGAVEKKGKQTSNQLATAIDTQTVTETIEVIGKTRNSLAQHLDVTKQRLDLFKEKLRLTQGLTKFYNDSMKILSPYRKEGEKRITGESFLVLYKNSKVFVHQTFIFFTTLPDKYNKAQVYFSNSDNAHLVIDYIIKIGINIASWVSILIFFRLYYRRFLVRFRIHEKGLSKKIPLCALKIAYSCSIPAIILAVTYISIKILGITPGRGWSSIILFALIAYLFYEFISCLAAHLFSIEKDIRLIPCREKTARFLQKWIRGLTVYTASFVVINFSANTLEASGVLLFLLRSVFNIGLLVFFTIFAHYWRYEIVKFLISPTLKELETTTVESRLSRFKLYKRIVRYLYTILVFYVFAIVCFGIAGYTSLSSFLTFTSLGTLGIILIGLVIYKGLKKSLLRKLSFLSELAKQKKTIISFAFVYSALRQVIIFTLGFVILNFVLAIWNIPIYQFIAFGTFLTIIKRIFFIILIIVAGYYFLKFFVVFVDKLFSSTEAKLDIFSTRRKQTIAPLMKDAAKYLTFFFAVVLILRQIGINTSTILAGVGIAGLAIGFGAQTLVKDIITGFFIIFEDSISVGDVVMVGDIRGFVEKVGIRVTKLRTLSGQLEIIPNGEIGKIGNFNREWMRAIIEVGIAYEGDIDKAMKTLKEISDQYTTEHPDIVLAPPEVQGILEFGASEVTIRVLIKVLPMRHWEVEREIKLRIKKGFDEKGIEIPFPRHVVYHREDASLVEKTESSSSSALVFPKSSEPEKELPSQT
ncbi:MAG: mechanosensitive ion channel domain-containing protein, partial [Candidatus Brocadiales bacterium]